LLKIIGGGVAGAFAASLPLPDHLLAANQQPDDLWSLVVTSPVFLTALEQVQAQGCSFTLEAASFTQVAAQDALVGLHLRQSSRPSQRLGIDFLCTVDTVQRTVVGVQYLIGTSLECSLEVRSVLLTPASLEPLIYQTRTGLRALPGPHQATSWSFPRPSEAIPPPPDDQPDEGWPPDIVSPLHWFYAGQQAVAWSADSPPLLRGSQVAEQRSSDLADTQTFALSYLVVVEATPDPTPEPTEPPPEPTATPTGA
jgi:hypothetical protein